MSDGELQGREYIDQLAENRCLFYCYKQFEIKGKMPRKERLPLSNADDDDDAGDRSDSIYGSLEIDFSNINRLDAQVIIKQMPNKRYGELIRLRYLELKTNEETAKELGMSMENYYNKHKLAKEQYERIFRKEVGNV